MIMKNLFHHRTRVYGTRCCFWNPIAVWANRWSLEMMRGWLNSHLTLTVVTLTWDTDRCPAINTYSGMKKSWLVLLLQQCPPWLRSERAPEQTPSPTAPFPPSLTVVPVAAAKFTLSSPQVLEHITLGFCYFPMEQHKENHMKCHSTLRSCPTTLFICSLLILNPPSPITAALILRAGVSGERAEGWDGTEVREKGSMKPSQMGINKETGLKDSSCYGQRDRGALGWVKKCHCCHIRSDHMFDTPLPRSTGIVLSHQRRSQAHRD